MIIEIAQNAVAISIPGLMGYLAYKSCNEVDMKDTQRKYYKPGKWARRVQWSARYVALAALAILMLPVGMIIGPESVADLEDANGKKLVKLR